MNNNLQGINNSILDEAENPISDLEYKEAKNTQSEQKKKNLKKNEDNVRSIWDFKHTNTCILGGVNRKNERARN